MWLSRAHLFLSHRSPPFTSDESSPRAPEPWIEDKLCVCWGRPPVDSRPAVSRVDSPDAHAVDDLPGDANNDAHGNAAIRHLSRGWPKFFWRRSGDRRGGRSAEPLTVAAEASARGTAAPREPRKVPWVPRKVPPPLDVLRQPAEGSTRPAEPSAESAAASADRRKLPGCFLKLPRGLVGAELYTGLIPPPLL